MKLEDNWFTAFSENEQGQMITVLGRDGLTDFRMSGKFSERVEIFWKYETDDKGFPTEETADLMEKVEKTLQNGMEKDKLAINTAIYTGGGEKSWVFYTRKAQIFGERLNELLQSFDKLPITITTECDTDWEEYLDMYEMKQWALDQD